MSNGTRLGIFVVLLVFFVAPVCVGAREKTADLGVNVLERVVKLEELRKAQENKEIKKLENQLMLIGISSVSLSGGEKYGAVLIDKYIGFLKELFADKESQKIFREYSKKGIMIFVGKKYQVYKFGYVTVDVNDGVKSIAEKLKR